VEPDTYFVGRLGGVSAEINLDTLARNRLTVVGVTFRTRGPREVGQVAHRMYDDLFPMLESRMLEPVIDRAFPLGQVVQAHEYLAQGSPFGKVVLSLA
jgi:NADPH:quinone reductase